MKNCIDEKLNQIEVQIRENHNDRRDTQRDLTGLEFAKNELAPESRHALDARIAATQARINALAERITRLEGVQETLRTLQDHLDHAAHWQNQVNALVKRHAAETARATAKIAELEASLAAARQNWFLGKAQRSDLDKLRSRIGEQRALLEDLTDPAGIPTLIAEQRSQCEKYRVAVDKITKAVEQIAPEIGVTDAIQATLDAALVILTAAGRTLSRGVTCRS